MIYSPFNTYPNWARSLLCTRNCPRNLSLINVLYSHLMNVVVFPVDGMWSQLTDDPPVPALL